MVTTLTAKYSGWNASLLFTFLEVVKDCSSLSLNWPFHNSTTHSQSRGDTMHVHGIVSQNKNTLGDVSYHICKGNASPLMAIIPIQYCSSNYRYAHGTTMIINLRVQCHPTFSISSARAQSQEGSFANFASERQSTRISEHELLAIDTRLKASVIKIYCTQLAAMKLV